MGIKKFNDGLTAKQKKFVDYFEGDPVEAARLAGYHYGTSADLMKNPIICDAIRKRKIENLDPLIKSRNARLKWIADQVNREKHGIRNRLKAMEMLQKSCGDYLEPGAPTGGQLVAPPTVIVIRPGKDSPTNIMINGPEPAHGEALPLNEGIGEELPDKDGTDWMDGEKLPEKD